MGNKSRTQYSAYNTTIAMISRIFAILMGYVVRVIFTHTLSESYVGINGLFTDILNVLSLSEMGIETAISFALYKPIAKDDIESQKSIMNLYKWFYRGVAAFVAIAGLLVIPFMDVLIKNKPDIDNLTYIYLLFLFNTVISYLFAYKRTLIEAHQLMYISTLARTLSWIIQDIVQIIVLLSTKNFILFLYVYILCTFLSNLYISKKADKMYPYIKDKNILPLNKNTRKTITKNIRAMMMHKIGDVMVNNTDNLLLSSIVGIRSVGCYSNYVLIIGSIQQILNEAFAGITASVGNLGATTDSSRVKKIFEASFFLNNWMYGLSAICLFELINPFVELSFGSQFVFPLEITTVLCINFFIKGMLQSCLVFRNSLGLFWYDRYKSIAEAAINLVVSITLAFKFGAIGVFIGTLVSAVTTSMWVEPFVLYKHHFKETPLSYYKKLILYCTETVFIWVATHYISDTFITEAAIHNIFALIAVKFVFCFIFSNMLYFIINFRSKEFKFLEDKLKRLLKERGI